MIYAAYGSNLNHQQMRKRCPKATFIGVGKIQRHRLVFRRVADIEPAPSDFVSVGLWDITKECLAALDRYEGFPNLYDRKTINVNTKEGDVTAIFYFMLATGYEYPSQHYYDSIRDGYNDCGLPHADLWKAIEVVTTYLEG